MDAPSLRSSPITTPLDSGGFPRAVAYVDDGPDRIEEYFTF